MYGPATNRPISTRLFDGRGIWLLAQGLYASVSIPDLPWVSIVAVRIAQR